MREFDEEKYLRELENDRIRDARPPERIKFQKDIFGGKQRYFFGKLRVGDSIEFEESDREKAVKAVSLYKRQHENFNYRTDRDANGNTIVTRISAGEPTRTGREAEYDFSPLDRNEEVRIELKASNRADELLIETKIRRSAWGYAQRRGYKVKTTKSKNPAINPCIIVKREKPNV